MVTERDKSIIAFLEKYHVANTDTINELFFNNLKSCHRRLKVLSENKIIRRSREHFTMQYNYYIRKPQQLRHKLLLTDFYRELNKLVDIQHFDNEVSYGSIRADGLVAFRYKKRGYIALIEVHISNNPLIQKYEKFFYSGEYKKYFPTFPKIYVISNKNIPDSKNFEVITIKEELSKITI